jgi:hypothetical protein
MRKFSIGLGFGFLLVCVECVASGSAEINTSLGQVVGQCKPTGENQKRVWIFKQWHLDPKVDTHKGGAQMPQLQNQQAIFQQIDSWIKDKTLDTVFSEGCSGEIGPGFSKKYNGWGYDDLASASREKDFDAILTLIPLKLKAKFGNKIHVLCADDDGLIDKQNHSFSDIRGILGFLTRLDQFKSDPERAKPYLKTVIQLYHLPETTTVGEATQKLSRDFKTTLSDIERELDDRNRKFAENLTKNPTESAFVVGGLHAKGLVKLLEEKNRNCTVVEPKGYNPGDEKAIEELEAKLK